MSELQIKFIRFSVVAMASMSIFQALTIRRLVKNLNTGREQFKKLHDGAEYLLNVLEEHDIELTEFDVIALTDILEGSNAS